MRLHLCGVRGSTPAPGPDFVRYGGDTSCVAISRDAEGDPTLVLDAGTGLRRLTSILGGRPFRGTILLSHLHWDHFQGLPFFAAGDRDDAQVRLVIPADADGGAGAAGAPDSIRAGKVDAEEMLARVMAPPFFPIRPGQLRGKWTFDAATTGVLQVDGYEVDAREIPHKGGRTFGYRVTDGVGSLAYLPDHCPTVLGTGPDGLGEYHPAALQLARDVDVLVHDAHLLAGELAEHASFGHSAAEYAVELARRAGARRVVLSHHAPERTDAALDRIAKHFAGSTPPVLVAVGGATVDASGPEL